MERWTWFSLSDLIQKPEWVPCITSLVGKKSTFDLEQNSKHLISPHPDIPFVKAKELTIVDCRTFALRKNPHIAPVRHYMWFIDFVREVQKEKGLVFIPPDADWIGERTDQSLAERWINLIENSVKCLVVPGTAIFKLLLDPSGYAVRPNQNFVHPEWTHSFTRDYDPRPKKTKFWSYDSFLK